MNLRILPGCLLACCSVTLLAQEGNRWRMPDYGREQPPPARTQAEVEQLLSGAPDNPVEPKDLQLLLVAGPKDHGPGEHDYPAWQKIWAPLLKTVPQTIVDTAWEFPTAEQLKIADVAVFYQRGDWNSERAAAIDAFLARGGGLVYIHWAVDGRGDVPGFAERIGLAAQGGSIKFRHGPLDVDFSPAAEHPIARNLDRVQWVDESYWQLTGDPKRIQVLATVVEEEAPRPLFWVREHQRGRIFVSIPGHYAWTFDDPLFRAVLLRGMAWAGRRPVDRFNGLVTEGIELRK